MKSLFEQLDGTYTLAEDDIYYPDLVFPEDEEPCYGKYVRMRKQYLREHKKWLYDELLMGGKLVAHLNKSDDAAYSRMELIIKQMKERQHMTKR